MELSNFNINDSYRINVCTIGHSDHGQRILIKEALKNHFRDEVASLFELERKELKDGYIEFSVQKINNPEFSNRIMGIGKRQSNRSR